MAGSWLDMYVCMYRSCTGHVQIMAGSWLEGMADMMDVVATMMDGDGLGHGHHAYRRSNSAPLRLTRLACVWPVPSIRSTRRSVRQRVHYGTHHVHTTMLMGHHMSLVDVQSQALNLVIGEGNVCSDACCIRLEKKNKIPEKKKFLPLSLPLPATQCGYYSVWPICSKGPIGFIVCNASNIVTSHTSPSAPF